MGKQHATLFLEFETDGEPLTEEYLDWIIKQAIETADICGFVVCGGWDMEPASVLGPAAAKLRLVN